MIKSSKHRYLSQRSCMAYVSFWVMARIMKKGLFVSLLLLTLIWATNLPSQSQVVSPESASEKISQKNILLQLSLNDCLDISLKNNHRRPASRYALQISEDQHKQALSSYWPQLSLRAIFSQFDQYPNFVFPARNIPIPGQTITLPANSFGPGLPPGPVPLSSPASQFSVPSQNVKLMDSSNLLTSLNLTYPFVHRRRAHAPRSSKRRKVSRWPSRRCGEPICR